MTAQGGPRRRRAHSTKARKLELFVILYHNNWRAAARSDSENKRLFGLAESFFRRANFAALKSRVNPARAVSVVA